MNFKKYLKHQKELNRRSFIVGAGTTVLGLPFLESLYFSKYVKAQATAPLRVLFGLIDNGLFRYDQSRNKVHPDVVKKLDELKSKRNIYYNSNNTFTKQENKLIHYSVAISYATGMEKRLNIPKHVKSFDQYALELKSTQGGYGVKSYQLVASNKVSNSKGFRASYSGGAPLPAQFNVIQAYKALLPGAVNNTVKTTNKVDELKALKRGSLHFFNSSINDLKKKLSRNDNIVLDKHLTNMDDLDRSIRQIAIEDIKNGCPKINSPASNSISYKRRREIMADLIYTAFVCDSTRVISMVLNDGREGSPGYEDFLPNFKLLYNKIKGASSVDGGYARPSHHSLTHFGNVAKAAKIKEAEVLKGVRDIDLYNVGFFVDIAKRLDSVSDGPGKTILDNSLIKFGGGLGSAKIHKGDKIPTFTIGSAGGAIKTGVDQDMKGNKLSGLHRSLLQAMGSKINSFGNSGAGGTQKSDIV